MVTIEHVDEQRSDRLAVYFCRSQTFVSSPTTRGAKYFEAYEAAKHTIYTIGIDLTIDRIGGKISVDLSQSDQKSNFHTVGDHSKQP